MHRQRWFVVWLVVAPLCCAAMWLWPGSETVPYHLACATFALCYGLEHWSRRATLLSLAAFTIATGSILATRAAQDVIDWQETSEIPLMLLLMLLMVWHVRRRNRAVDAVTVLAERERSEAEARELLTQRTSHEMRSPLTIARGYLEMVMARDPEGIADLRIIDDELARLSRVCERLVRSMRVQGDFELSTLDLDAVLAQTVLRWGAVADRDWRDDGGGATLTGSPERLVACLDTLVENALRYTSEGDVISLYARTEASGHVVIGVADSGRGFSPEMLRAAAVQGVESGLDGVRDDLSQTGLGLSLVRDVTARRGGWVRLGVSPDGGADVSLVVPLNEVNPSLPQSGPGVLAAPDPVVALGLRAPSR
ncbi:MAG: HAMP domain-containing sensor histidine kinase [Terracoccus sp.]